LLKDAGIAHHGPAAGSAGRRVASANAEQPVSENYPARRRTDRFRPIAREPSLLIQVLRHRPIAPHEVKNEAIQPLQMAIHCVAPRRSDRAVSGQQSGSIGSRRPRPIPLWFPRPQKHICAEREEILSPGDCPNFRISENGTVPFDALYCNVCTTRDHTGGA